MAIDGYWKGRRQDLSVELATWQIQGAWRGFRVKLKNRGLCGVEFVLSDEHAGLKKTISEVLTDTAWQRGHVHCLRNMLDYLPRKADDDRLQELRRIYNPAPTPRRYSASSPCGLGKWQAKYPKLVDWAETNIGETLAFYRLPRAHHKHLKSTNMLERPNEEVKRRKRVARIFPDTESCLRLIRALCLETHETWLADSPYLNITLLAEHKKALLRLAA